MALIVIILSLLAVIPLTHAGFFSFHDFQQVARLYELDKTLLSGVFPVRWVPDLGFGYGYPLFNFYPPFVYYLGEFFHLIFRLSFLDSIKVVWAVALVGSAITMYLLGKELFGKLGGLVSSVFYLYAPYHAVDAYVRGALAELFSFVWLPLILLSSYRGVKEKSLKWAIITGIFLALLMLTHNLVFLPFFTLFTVWYFVLALIYQRRSLLRTICHFLLVFAFAFGLSAFFWLPALSEKQFTLTDQFLTGGLAAYKLHFVCPEQLWNSLWGYGGSVAGCLDGLSFKIGKPHILASVVIVVLACLLYLRKKISGPTLFLLSAIFLLFLMSAFMTTVYSQPVWNTIQPLWYLQFPWRFLEFAALFSALAAGAFIHFVKPKFWQVILAAGLIFAVLFLHGKYFQPQTFLPTASDSTLLTKEEITRQVSFTSFEFMPKGVKVKPTIQGSFAPDISSFPSTENFMWRGQLREQSWQIKPNEFRFVGNFLTDSQLLFPIVNFPGWQVLVDNKPAVINDANSLKLISIETPAGQHVITGKFTDTPIRLLGNFISLSAIIALAAIFLWNKKK